MGKIAAKTWEESKKSWEIAGPTIITALLQFSIGFVTVGFVGHIGPTELSAVSIAQNVIQGLAYGVMLGMGSALETLCGQAVGANDIRMLGVYVQRSWIICIATAIILIPLYVFAAPILKLLHQAHDISDVAGKYCWWVIPQLFGYAVNFPMQKFFQSQTKVWVITTLSGIVLAIHVFLNWLVIVKLKHGLVGAAIVENIAWWLLNLGQIIYLMSGCFKESWTGFSRLAFQNIFAFVKLSLSSAVMMCLELWYYTAVILLVGLLKNPEIAVGAITICMNYQLWTLTVALGFNAAVSVRVSNELGANHAKAAKFAVIVSVATSAIIGVLFMVAVFILKDHLPKFFTDVPEIIRQASELGYLLGVTILLNSIQPVLSGVAIGAGWQALVAFINIGCYYILGLPLGAIFGFKLKLKELGIWVGMLIGTVAQTVILLIITFRTKWQKEANEAEERIRTWGGRIEPEPQQ